VQEHLNAYLEGRSDSYAIEHRLQHKSGTWLWMLTRGKVVDRDAQGAPIRMTGTVTDVSQRKQQEEELRTFKLLVENARDAIAVAALDSDGKLLYANPAYNAMLGHTDSAVGSNFLDAYAESPERMQEVIQEAMVNGSWQGTMTYRRSDGSTLPGHLSGFILYDANNQPYAAAGIIRDMSAQQQQEEQLRTFKQVVENASDAISLVDAQTGNITYYNEAHRQMYRCGDSHLGQSIGVIVAPEDQEQLPGILQDIVETGIWRGQLQHIRQDGTTFPALESCFTIKDEHGNTITMVGIVRDISDIVQAEAERATLQQQVIEAQQAALRELSTPLVPIADGVLAMPLVGTIDSGRAMMIMESLLEGVSSHQAEIAIVDITGVQIIDTQVANALISAARATKLLGAQVVLTGIQSQIAQTLVHLGVDLSDIVTRSTLQAGIAYAMGKK
jgi:rsbT co-antagonist protein RsbR